MGQLLSYWMGVEGTVFATVDWPDSLIEYVESVNANTLDCVDLICTSPAKVVLMGDNFSSDIQPPAFFERYSAEFYREAVRRFHAAGIRVAVHVDGKLRGALAMIRDTGADIADAVTPAPFGDLTPDECLEEAGPKFVMSGGIPPNLWLPSASSADFERSIRAWLDLTHRGGRIIANAGDQVPVGADERRIELMREIVDEYN